LINRKPQGAGAEKEIVGHWNPAEISISLGQFIFWGWDFGGCGGKGGWRGEEHEKKFQDSLALKTITC